MRLCYTRNLKSSEIYSNKNDVHTNFKVLLESLNRQYSPMNILMSSSYKKCQNCWGLCLFSYSFYGFVEKDCGPPPQIQNGELSFITTTYGSKGKVM